MAEDEHDSRPAAAFQPKLGAMAAVATLRTAATVAANVAARRAGRDPADQEAPGDARTALADSADDLAVLLTALRTRLAVYTEPEAMEAGDEQAALVRAFEDRMAMLRLSDELHRVHQRLLSLYPEVDMYLPEVARRLQQEAATLLEVEARFDRRLEGLVEAAGLFVDALAEAL